ncbi:hypothetical protein CLV62_14324 [Dysgonomonas alginatilytica]|uniref:Fimbrillin-like protein n=1 Tax=Dysgonomonas alginatilytica TaxID=1605892 RepID=A0A2V3PIR1_9BACT|nr:hypothetical protein [Dysgonomonas alginatilytica]PXV58844.1 hypothetical protein CLV62_14324 [Dysgonomonas alginatilytica]
MNLKNILLCLMILASFEASAQVGINTESPDPSAILDIVSSNKGILIPRVELTSIDMNLDGLSGQAEGLLVYNTGSVLAKGYYYWNGSEWTNIETNSAISPKIDLLVCAEVRMEPQVFKAGVPFVGTIKMPYTGGNGGKYPAASNWVPSTGNTGLSIRLKAGRLEYGYGYLTYDITGTPRFSSPTAASFPITFLDKNCTITTGDAEDAVIKNRATVGRLQATNDNGASGFHRVITSPDGKYSVRVFVPNGVHLANADLQIRSNLAPLTIMWNGHVSYQGGTLGHSSNALRLPLANMWYGNTIYAGNYANSDTAIAVSTDANAAWGDPDVYYYAPEQRSYMWTSTDVNDKTVYTLSFMMGAPNPFVGANESEASKTKAYLQINQIRATE